MVSNNENKREGEKGAKGKKRNRKIQRVHKALLATWKHEQNRMRRAKDRRRGWQGTRNKRKRMKEGHDFREFCDVPPVSLLIHPKHEMKQNRRAQSLGPHVLSIVLLPWLTKESMGLSDWMILVGSTWDISRNRQSQIRFNIEKAPMRGVTGIFCCVLFLGDNLHWQTRVPRIIVLPLISVRTDYHTNSVHNRMRGQFLMFSTLLSSSFPR